MQVSNPLFAQPVVSVPSTSAAVQSWQVGQLLQAIVVSAKSTQQATLLIGNTRIDASTPKPLAEGQKLQLEVTQTGTTTLLKVLNAPPQENPVNAALRQALPKQEPLQPLLQTLVKLSKEQPELKGKTSDPVKLLIQTLTRSFSSPVQLSTPQGLKQAIQNSGVFLESKLAQALSDKAARIPEGDLKANLLKLADQLRTQEPANIKKLADTVSKPATPSSPRTTTQTASTGAQTSRPGGAPIAQVTSSTTSPLPGTNTNTLQSTNIAAPKQIVQTPLPARANADLNNSVTADLMRQVETAVARIQTHQLTTLAPVASDEPALPQWTLELPVKVGEHAETVRLEIQQDENTGTNGKETTWTITLQFDFENIGKMSARVSISGEQVSTVFFSNNSDTQQRIKANLGWLQTRLEEAGLDIQHLSAIVGELSNNLPAPIRQFLLNEKA